jgi:hypothetical protein
VGRDGGWSGSGSLSECQYHEFVAVDRPQDLSELGALQELSTLAHITMTSFVNVCHWDNYQGEPRVLTERYFDVLIDGSDLLMRAETVRRVRPDTHDCAGLPAAGHLRTLAPARRAECEGAEHERWKRAAPERTRRAVQARRRLAACPTQGEQAWRRVAVGIAEKEASGYYTTVDPREVTAPADFTWRIEQVRHEHARKPAFLERLTNAGL